MATVQVPIQMLAPDSTGSAYTSMVAGTNLRGLFPAYKTGVDSKWFGIVRIPEDYNSAGHVIPRIAANSTAGQVARLVAASIVLDTSAGWDASGLTAETAINTTLASTAYRPSDVDFTLSTTPIAGKDLYVSIQRNGANVADTLVVDLLLFAAVFQYST